MVAVINSPQKSGTTRTPSLEKRKPPNSEPIRPMIRLRSSPRGALVILAASQPAIRPIRIHANTPIVNLLMNLQEAAQAGHARSLPADSHVQHPSIRVEHRLFHHLRQRRMREDGVHELLLRGLEIHRHHVALDQLGDLGAHHVRAEQLSGRLVEYHLHQALIFAKRDRLAVADEWETANPHIALLLLGGLLGETDRGNLRRAISATGNEALLHRMWLETLDRLDADDAFVLGLVRKQRRARNVAD